MDPIMAVASNRIIFGVKSAWAACRAFIMGLFRPFLNVRVETVKARVGDKHLQGMTPNGV